ncbi:D-Ala-D-Ala carboxypeptidase family metallohydrolase [Bdellovibrionales bacterium]|nr:D-Ala-D-Ala carboxypeptidase family metallohydrolase [Bdellovibrionales bacterium]
MSINLLFTILLALSLTSCNSDPLGVPVTPNQNQGVQEPSEPPHPQIEEKEFCFPNNGSGLFCLPLYMRPEEYGYKDPLPENGFPDTRDPLHYHPPTYLFKKSDYSPNRHVTKNFKWSEFFTNDSEALGLVLPVLLESLQNIRDAVNAAVVINSAYRSPNYNSTIKGSAPWSRHTYGDAADFWSPKKNLKELKLECEQFGASYVQLYTTHVHCDWRTSLKEPPLFPIVKERKTWEPKLAAPAKISIRVTSSTIYATAPDTHKEDGAPLFYEWIVTEDGHSDNPLELLGPEISWPRISDSYKIHLVIGGNLTIKKSINLEDFGD